MPDTANLTALLLTKTEVAALLTVPERSVQWLHRVGQLRGVKIARKLRWTRASIDRYLQTLESEASA